MVQVVEEGVDADAVAVVLEHEPIALWLKKWIFASAGLLINWKDEVFNFFPHYAPRVGQLPGATLRQGDWKLIRFFHDNPDQTHRYELFNLADDIGETKNVAHLYPEKVNEMDARIEEVLVDADATVPVKNESYIPSEAEYTFQGWSNADTLDNAEITENGLLLDPTSFGPHLLNTDITDCSGDCVLQFSMHSDHSGPGQVIVYEKDSPHRVLPEGTTFDYSTEKAFQTIECAIAAENGIEAIRLEPSRLPYEVTIRKITLKTADGKTVQSWDFTKTADA